MINETEISNTETIMDYSVKRKKRRTIDKDDKNPHKNDGEKSKKQ